jgi:hypothetical protein
MHHAAALTKNTDPLLLASNVDLMVAVRYHSKKGILAEMVLRLLTTYLPCSGTILIPVTAYLI